MMDLMQELPYSILYSVAFIFAYAYATDFKDFQSINKNIGYTLLITFTNLLGMKVLEGLNLDKFYVLILVLLILDYLTISLFRHSIQISNFIYSFPFLVIFVLYETVLTPMIMEIYSLNYADTLQIGIPRTFIACTNCFITVISYVYLMKSLRLLNRTLPKNYYVLYLSLTIVFFSMPLIYYHDIIQRSYTIGSFILFIFIVASYWLFNCFVIRLSRLFHEKYESETVQFVSEINQKYLKGIEGEHEKIRQMNHDIKNHLLTMKTMLHSHDNIEAYLEGIQSSYEQVTLIHTGNQQFDAVINAKIEELSRIHFTVVAALPPIIGLRVEDICSLIFNLMDNAAEAVENNDNPEVTMKLKYQAGTLLITTENACPFEPTFITTKKQGHGYGMKIIKNIIARYDGMFSYQFLDEKLKIMISLNCVDH